MINKIANIQFSPRKQQSQPSFGTAYVYPGGDIIGKLQITPEDEWEVLATIKDKLDSFVRKKAIFPTFSSEGLEVMLGYSVGAPTRGIIVHETCDLPITRNLSTIEINEDLKPTTQLGDIIKTKFGEIFGTLSNKGKDPYYRDNK